MTHAEFTARDAQGFRSACPGALRHVADCPDTLATEAGPVDQVVTLHSCECGVMISSAGDRILNVYRAPALGVGFGFGFGKGGAS